MKNVEFRIISTSRNVIITHLNKFMSHIQWAHDVETTSYHCQCIMNCIEVNAILQRPHMPTGKKQKIFLSILIAMNGMLFVKLIIKISLLQFTPNTWATSFWFSDFFPEYCTGCPQTIQLCLI